MARTQKPASRRVIVVGAGVAGLSLAVELCQRNVPVLLLGATSSVGSPSAWTQSGINSAADARGQRVHLEDTLACGDYFANQPPVRAMVEAAPELVALFDRMGVPFSRSGEGAIERFRQAGSRRARSAQAGTRTGQALVSALEEQARRFETLDVVDVRGASLPGEKLLHRQIHWQFVALVLDDNGVAVGVVAEDLKASKLRALPADAVGLATGGFAGLFARSSSGQAARGDAAGAVFLQGAALANADFVQFHPTAFDGGDKPRVVAERARMLGGRIWLPKDRTDQRRSSDIPERERDYFLERLYPGWGNAVPADLAARAMQRCFAEERGARDAAGARLEQAYLDLSHLDEAAIDRALGPTRAAYHKLSGDNPLLKPLCVFPAVHATLGGLWVDYEARADGTLEVDSPRSQATSLPGLYAAGDVEFQFHGRCRLGGNALLARAFAAKLAAAGIIAYRQALARSAFDLPGSIFERAEAAEQKKLDELIAQSAGAAESPIRLESELTEVLFECASSNAGALERAASKIEEIAERAARAASNDAGHKLAASLLALRRLDGELAVARAYCASARRRAASQPREAAATKRATLFASSAGREVKLVDAIEYASAGRRVRVADSVETSLVPPRERRYDEEALE
jgi:succinate dehydrogenase / fumarate reductase, flavoprotein subunit